MSENKKAKDKTLGVRLGPEHLEKVRKHQGAKSQRSYLEQCIDLRDKMGHLFTFFKDVEGQVSRLEKYTGKIERDWNRQPAQYTMELLKRVEKTYLELQEKFETLEARKKEEATGEGPGITRSYFFVNMHYPDLLCSRCGGVTFKKKVQGQVDEEGIKTYLCPDCQVESETDPALFKAKKRLMKLRRILKEADKELEIKLAELEDMEGWIRTDGVIEQIHIALCKKAKETKNDDLRQLLHNYIRIFSDLRELEKDFSELNLDDRQVKSVMPQPTRKAQLVQGRRRRGYLWKMTEDEYRELTTESRRLKLEMEERRKRRKKLEYPI